MENEIPETPLPPPESQIETQPQFAPRTEVHKPVAPAWHTILIVIIVLYLSYLSSKQAGGPGLGSHGRISLYTATILQNCALLGIVWFGLWLKKVRLRDLIGGTWKPVDLVLDVLVAASFWLVSLIILVTIRLGLGTVRFDQKASADAVKTVSGILPHSTHELPGFILVALMAGFFEEILFRGYLQKQLSAFTGSAYAGLIISGALFGAAHGYQGVRMMVVLAIYGMMFGLLAHFRKNLRPGMMAHAWQDSIAGITFLILTKYKLI
ncbi:MAG TPA: type II CAAX endopeptidase family protein [Candidatus Saccharimonadales bacterium]|jgi:membrane protease YdiL (CAAX protease family)|nr:type II CAAX endopeptidase family protein [Candidatus Saccharimonadales bacterium]